MQAVRYITVLMLGLFAWACQQSEPMERASVGGRAGKSSDLSEEPSDSDQASSGGKKKKPSSKKDGGEDEEDSDDESGDTPDKKQDDAEGAIDFPHLSFNGAGYTTYKMKDRLAMSMGIETKLDDDTLTIETRTAKVECGGKSGCDQKEVDRSVGATSIGANVYQRATASELRALRSSGFNAASYGIFAKSVRGKNGINFTFDKPLPVYPWPAAKSRYEALKSGTESWTATATADRNIPNRQGLELNSVQNDVHIRSGNAKKELQVTITVAYEDLGSSRVKLTFTVDIADDRNRMLYKYFPVPRSSAFVINTTEKDVRSVAMTNWSHGDKSREQEESVLDYKLCSKTTSSNTKTYACQ